MSCSRGMQCLVLLTLLTHLLVGCLPAASSEQPPLLGQDYLKMTDAQLVAYEQQLSDELVRASRSTNRDVSVGVGFGSWGGSTGYGVHADRWLGGTKAVGPARAGLLVSPVGHGGPLHAYQRH